MLACLPLSVRPAGLDEQTRIQIEALNRLKGMDLEANPALKKAVLTVVQKTRGTAEFVTLVDEFKLTGQEAALLEYALAHPQAIDRIILVGPVVGGLSFSEHFNNRNRENFRPLAEQRDMAGTIARWARDPYIIAGNNEAARRRMQEL